MITFRCSRQTRISLYPLPLSFFYSTTATTPHREPPSFHTSYRFLPTSESSSSASPSTSVEVLPAKDLVLPFKQWFMSRQNPLFDRIFDILNTQDRFAANAALRCFNIRISESLVLEILNYGKSTKDVLSCLKFFDWAGHQRDFSHTRATFHAIFRILSQAKLLSPMFEFLENFKEQKYVHQVRFYDTLVIGYAVAGKVEIALQVFGRMRFQGVDLDQFAYHVLLNSLVEEGYFDVVDMIADQIRLRGVENELTHSIIVRSFCKQKDLDGAESYLRGLMVANGDGMGKVGLTGVVVGTVVDALCQDKQYDRAGRLVEEVRKLGTVSMEYAYGVWIRSIIQAGNLDQALEYYRSKKEVYGYVPDVYRYNSLVCRLLKENKVEEVFDLLKEMIEQDILPDEVTMNATLCFLCKAERVDAAMELYDSREELGLSMNSMAYNYLINTLFGDMYVDEAYRVLKNAIEQGHFPGKKVFSVITNALCREDKLDKVKDLVVATLDRNFIPSDSIYDTFIAALCRNRRVEDGYEILGKLNGLDKVTSKNTYFKLISGFYKTGRGDIATNLLLEMQEKGYKPNRRLFRDVICRLLQMEDSEKQYFRLLKVQLSRYEPTCNIYNFFIDGARHAGKPELARQVYELMKTPNLTSDLLMLQSYLKSNKIADALNFFSDLSSKRTRIPKRIWNSMIVGLSKAGKPDFALEKFWEMKANQLKPSMECYEELVKVLCDQRQYRESLEIVDDLSKIGRPMSSFIGNVLLLHTLRSPILYKTWCDLSDSRKLEPRSLMLGKVIEAFSDSIKGEYDVRNLEEVIPLCFRPDIYTYNMFLRILSMTEINHACEYFKRIPQKGYEPNRWSYDIVVHGLRKCNRIEEAERLVEEMWKKGFDLTEATKKLRHYIGGKPHFLERRDIIQF